MPSREKTCGYCGKKLGSNYFRDLMRTRGWFCSGDHCMKFIEDGPLVPGLREDEVESLHEVKQKGYTDYEDRNKPAVKTKTKKIIPKKGKK